MRMIMPLDELFKRNKWKYMTGRKAVRKSRYKKAASRAYRRWEQFNNRIFII